MSNKTPKNQHVLEIALVLVIVGLACLMYRMSGYKIIVLNLFYLPIVLAGFFLGRYRAGVLAFLGVILTCVVTILTLNDFAPFNSPIVIGLAVTLWGAVLGLSALLTGTLSDELSTTMDELHEAYVGVVEVLSQYLQCANPSHKVRSQRVSELSHAVGNAFRLSQREVDDIRVAALLYDMENIEITAKVIRKAVGDLESQQEELSRPYTFHGTELAQSIGSVLSGAFPLLLTQDDALQLGEDGAEGTRAQELPLSGQIIRAVRAYDALVYDANGQRTMGPAEAIKELGRDAVADHHVGVLAVLESVVSQPGIAGAMVGDDAAADELIDADPYSDDSPFESSAAI